jgi:hypothetical protein
MRAKHSFRRSACTAIILALMWPLSVFGQTSLEVDEQELETQIDRSVEFQNYTGPYDWIDPAQEIFGIGRSLAAQATVPGGRGRIGNSYRIVRAADPDVLEGLDGDILYILPEGRVDHIDNVRRILAGYLAAAYDYSRADALLLAELVTIYNAIYRGNLDFYRSRYKDVVLRNLSSNNVGISTLYSDWPGATELVTPLAGGAEPGRLRSIDPVELTDENVEEELREREDRGIETREDAVDLMERAIDQEEERVQEEEEAIAEAEEELRQREEDLRRDAEEATTEEEQQRIAEEQAEIDEERQELAERRDAVEEEREEVEELTEAVRERRERIAEDRRELLGAGGIADVGQVLFLRVRERGDGPLGQLVYVDAETGRVETESPVATVTSRAFERVSGDLLLVGESDGRSRLLLLGSEDLTVRLSGEDEIFPESVLVVRDGGREIYAVVRADGGWHLGRFDDALSLRERSTLAVTPYTNVEFGDNRVWVQGQDGGIVGLDSATLSRLP